MAERIDLNPLAPREAIEYFRSKGFAPALQRFDYRDHWREEHARNFVVAKAMQDDVLALIQEEVDKALANGTTLDAFRDELAPKLQAQGWWGRSIERDPLTGELKDVELGSMRRLKVIFDTNIRTSYAAGQWARIQRTKAFLPYLEYRQLQRPTARDMHKPFDGLILPVDHPIWQKIFPPNGWFCGCYVRPVNQRMLDREGKSVTTDAQLQEIASSPWTNPRTGATEDLLDGIDPAFASNPGATWLDTEDRHAATALDLPEAAAGYDRGYVKELAALRMRDVRNAALAYSLGGPDGAERPLGMTRAAGGTDAAPLSSAMQAAMNVPEEQVVLLRSAPAGSTIGLLDMQRFRSSPGLTQVAVATPDGSIFRMARVQGGGFPSAQRLASDRARAVQEALAIADSAGLSQEDVDLIVDHAMALVLQREGHLRYAAAPSGRVALLLNLSSRLIESIISLLLPGQAFGRGIEAFQGTPEKRPVERDQAPERATGREIST